MGNFQDIFRMRVLRDPCPTADISVRRIQSVLHEMRKSQHRSDGGHETAASGIARESCNNNGSRQASSAALISSNAILINELHAATATIATLQQRLASCSCTTTPQTGARGQQRQQASQKRQQKSGPPNRYTTGTSIGLGKGINEKLQQRGNKQFANVVTTVTAARTNTLVALENLLYLMSCNPIRLTHNLSNDVFIINNIINILLHIYRINLCMIIMCKLLQIDCIQP